MAEIADLLEGGLEDAVCAALGFVNPSLGLLCDAALLGNRVIETGRDRALGRDDQVETELAERPAGTRVPVDEDFLTYGPDEYTRECLLDRLCPDCGHDTGGCYCG